MPTSRFCFRRQCQLAPINAEIVADRRDDDAMILTFRQARHRNHADNAGALDRYGKAAAGQHIVGYVQSLARLEGAPDRLALLVGVARPEREPRLALLFRNRFTTLILRRAQSGLEAFEPGIAA